MAKKSMTPSERREAILKVLCQRRQDKIDNLAFEFGVSVRTIKKRYRRAVSRLPDRNSSWQIWWRCKSGRRILCRSQLPKTKTAGTVKETAVNTSG